MIAAWAGRFELFISRLFGNDGACAPAPDMKRLKKLARKIREWSNLPVTHWLREHTGPDTAAQIQLRLTYQQLVASGAALPALGDVGFKVFSQADEDGILLYLFSLLGTTNKKCVEICAGHGMECNTANLIIHHGWTGLLMDGDPALVRQGQMFYKHHTATFIYPPTFVQAWITKDNINDLVRMNGFAGEIDLLSLDVDGVDYWIWQALEVIQPRVVVLEYQDIIGPEKCLTVPYTEDFSSARYPSTNEMPNFCGASLAAFTKLARRKGYRLVGCNRYGFNAFFVRAGLGEKLQPEIPVADCFTHPKVLWGMKERWPTVKDLPWVEV
jgi:hypothetical protein